MATDNNKMIILFDGVCNMCVWSIQFIISKDINNVFQFASLQSIEGEKFLAKYSLKKKSIVLIKNGVVKTRSAAVLTILYHLNTFWKFLLVFYIVPYPIRDFLYVILAKTRYFLFGKRDKCMVPNKNINSKFLSL
tara:strand:- start:183 stop:587 length:405 start_codon:yes stop_codon:yes gene_type:complete